MLCAIQRLESGINFFLILLIIKTLLFQCKLFLQHIRKQKLFLYKILSRVLLQSNQQYFPSDSKKQKQKNIICYFLHIKISKFLCCLSLQCIISNILVDHRYRHCFTCPDLNMAPGLEELKTVVVFLVGLVIGVKLAILLHGAQEEMASDTWRIHHFRSPQEKQ